MKKQAKRQTETTISKKRQRKIDHIRELRRKGEKKTRIRNKAIHHMKMSGEDIVAAFDGNSVY